MSLLKQIAAVTAMNLRSLPQRLGASLVIVIGIAGVVGVLICVLAMGVGFRQTVANTGRTDRAIVLSTSGFSESTSSMPRDAAQAVMDAPGVKKDSDGKPIVAAESLVQIQAVRKGGGAPVNVTLRGIGPEEALLRPEIRVVAGRMFRPALHELIVGSGAEAAFTGLSIGSHLSFQNGDWTVVGIFDSQGGSSHDSELMADAETLVSAYQRNWFQNVTALLDGPEAFDEFKAELAANPALQVEVRRESDYFADQSRAFSRLLTAIGYFVGGIMAVGALFAALNTMYAAVSARSLEIATLRAIGFGGSAVVVSVFVEALLLALAGALLGALLAWLFFNGHTMSMVSGSFTPTQLAFALAVTPGLVLLGVVWAIVIGLIGGLFPAIRAARLPVAAALRAI